MTRILLVSVGGTPDPIHHAVASHQLDRVVFVVSALTCQAPIFKAIEACHQAVHAMGCPRIYTTVKVNTRIDRDQTLEDKVASVETLTQQLPKSGQ